MLVHPLPNILTPIKKIVAGKNLRIIMNDQSRNHILETLA